MRKDVKIILIVVASLVGLLVIGFIAAVAFVVNGAVQGVANNKNPARQAQVAAKIADFSLPRGYRYLSATDFPFLTVALIAPSGGLKPGFVMELEGMGIPVQNESDDALMKSMEQGLSFGGSCKNFQSKGQDQVTTATGKPVVLTILQCTDGSSRRIMEFGRIPAKMALAVFMADGTPEAFDRDAVHALLGSIR